MNKELTTSTKLNATTENLHLSKRIRLKSYFSEWCDSNTRLSIPKTDTLPPALHSDRQVELTETRLKFVKKRSMTRLKDDKSALV